MRQTILPLSSKILQWLSSHSEKKPKSLQWSVGPYSIWPPYLWLHLPWHFPLFSLLQWHWLPAVLWTSQGNIWFRAAWKCYSIREQFVFFLFLDLYLNTTLLFPGHFFPLASVFSIFFPYFIFFLILTHYISWKFWFSHRDMSFTRDMSFP